MRCPHCQSLSTKRHGKTRSAPQGLDGPTKPLQRFLCSDCGKSFTSSRTVARPGARFIVEVVREAVRRYVQGLSSYRTLAVMLSRQLDVSVSPRMLNQWVDETGGQASSPLEMSARLRPSGWGGILGVDGKVIWVGGEQRCLLVAVDQASQDVVHRLVLPAETGLMRRRHLPVPEQGRWLASVVRGHCAYYAVPGNSQAVQEFRTQATRHWYRALRRRSQRTRLNWERMNRLATRWLPPARIQHPWPEQRFDARTRGRSPVR